MKVGDSFLVEDVAKINSVRKNAWAGATAFNIYRNAVGQIVLDPVKAIPAAEAWLWENPKALAAVRQGLKESAQGQTVYLGSFANETK